MAEAIMQTFTPTSIMDKLSGRYSPNSLKTMDQQAKRFFKALKLDKFDPTILWDINLFRKVINGFNKSNSKKSVCNTLIQMLKCIDDSDEALVHHRLFFKQLVHEHMHAYLFKDPEEKEVENLITLAELKDKFEEFKKKAKNNNNLGVNMKFAILACYHLFPPLRTQDWTNLRVIDSKTRKGKKLTEEYESLCNQHLMNLYNKHRGELYLKYGKTSGIHGTRVLTLPPKLKKILNNWIGMNNSDYLFSTQAGTPYTHNGFNSVMCSLFHPKNVSSSMLRKIYVSEICPKLTREQCHELAKKMGHSITTQQMIYCRFDS